jgi:hypothetical protein
MSETPSCKGSSALPGSKTQITPEKAIVPTQAASMSSKQATSYLTSRTLKTDGRSISAGSSSIALAHRFLSHPTQTSAFYSSRFYRANHRSKQCLHQMLTSKSARSVSTHSTKPYTKLWSSWAVNTRSILIVCSYGSTPLIRRECVQCVEKSSHRSNSVSFVRCAS